MVFHVERTRAPTDPALRYYPRCHLDVEKKHAVYEKRVDAYISSITLPARTGEQALALVDRAHRAFFAMFDDIQRRLADSATSSAPPAEPSGPPLALARTVLAPAALFAR